MTPNFALKLQCIFPSGNNFVGNTGAEESWLTLAWNCTGTAPCPSAIVWSQMGYAPGIPHSMVVIHTLCASQSQLVLPCGGRFSSPFTTSLLRLQVNHTACCRVCGWAWKWTSIFVSQPIVLVSLCSLGSDSALLKHPDFHFSIFFWFCVLPPSKLLPPLLFSLLATLHYLIFKYSENSMNGNITLWKKLLQLDDAT